MSTVGLLEFENNTIRYKWEISDFQTHKQNPNTCLLSPVFSTVHSSGVKKWRLRFYPTSTVREFASDYSSIILEYLSDGEMTVQELELSVSGYSGSAQYKSNRDVQLSPQNAKYSFNKFVEKNNNSFWIGYNSVTIFCKITTNQPLADSALKTVENSCNEVNDLDECRLDADLEKLFAAETLSDVTICIEESKISLHKAILASRSEVFRAMFEHDMVEKEQNVVNIVDTNLEIATEMFRYMYTDRLENIEKLDTEELFIAAEKYSVTGLQILCEKTLYLQLNFDNALRYLTLASKYKTIHLKKQVIDFIVNQLDEFIDKPEFKILDQNTMYDLLSSMAKKKKEK